MCFILAAGLYYLAELIEEYSVTAKYVISWLIFVSFQCYVTKFTFEKCSILIVFFYLLGYSGYSYWFNDIRRFTSVFKYPGFAAAIYSLDDDTRFPCDQNDECQFISFCGQFDFTPLLGV